MIVDAAPASTLASAAVPIVICVAAGSVVGSGNSRWPGADMLVGLGLVGGALTILAVATPIPLSGLLIAFAALSIVAIAIRRQIPGGSGTWIALALVSPIILVPAAGYQAALWDEFWQWLPSAGYAFSHNSLVKLGLADSLSRFPAYPQAMPLMIAAASLVAGRFLEAAGPMVNVVLLAGVSALLADAIAAALARRGRLAATDKPVFLVASAVTVTILLNPGLNGGVVLLSSLADCGTMVAVGALGLIGIEMLTRLAGRGPGNTESLAWRFGFVGALLVNLKQANPVLLVLVTAGLAVVSLRDPAIAKRQGLAQLPRMLGPPIIVWMIWRWYVMSNVPHGEVAFRPFGSWSFDELPDLFAAAWKQITEAPLFHAMMWMVTAAGFAAFFTLPRKASEARWLAVVCATVWLGYNAFLLVVYLGAFSGDEVVTAAAYWRYASHVALLALYAPVIALATGRWPAWMSLRGVAPALVVVPLALCALPVRGDLNDPGDRAWVRFIRDATTDMRHAMPAGSKVVIIPCWNGSLFGVIVRYDLWQLGVPERETHGTILWEETDDGPDPAVIASLATRGEANYLVIQDAECEWDDEDTDELGLSRINHELALFAWRNGAWEKVKSWPIPPALIYRDP
jgi:hypothetical protein